MSTDANRSIVGSSRWVWLVAPSVVAVSVAVIAAIGEFDFGASAADVVGFLFVDPMFAIAAALILTKLPRNTIGWMIMTVSSRREGKEHARLVFGVAERLIRVTS